jgi:hypothetical protein
VIVDGRRKKGDEEAKKEQRKEIGERGYFVA